MAQIDKTLARIEAGIAKLDAKIDTFIAAKGTPATTEVAGPTSLGPTLDFIQRMMPPQSTRTPEQEQRMIDAIARAYDQNAHFKGAHGVETLQPIDMAYLDSVRDSYFLKTGKDIRFDGVIGGKAKHINEVMNNGMAYKNQFDLENYNSPLKQEVERRIA